jgi:hypothetical protein
MRWLPFMQPERRGVVMSGRQEAILEEAFEGEYLS